MKKLKYILFSILLSFIYINNVKAAATCVYDSPANFPNKFTITCSGTNNCVINTSLNITITSNAASLSIEDTCPSNIYISSSNNTITSINTTSGNDSLQLNRNKSTEGSSNPSANPDNQAPGDTEHFDVEYFCKGPVQGVFTTLGWVFFILKILIPILLIIFGSIDVGKAVIASKDDEIKKSVKTLAIRAIAGIIIFFVPTILNFVVKLIDNSDVYNGTFWDCTKCMLDPTQDVCETLIGGSTK